MTADLQFTYYHDQICDLGRFREEWSPFPLHEVQGCLEDGDLVAGVRALMGLHCSLCAVMWDLEDEVE